MSAFVLTSTPALLSVAFMSASVSHRAMDVALPVLGSVNNIPCLTPYKIRRFPLGWSYFSPTRKR